jgi:hypothetical protein
MVPDLVIMVNMIVCGAIFWSCVCRLKMTHKGVFPRVRNRYVLIGGGSVFSAFGHYIFPIWGGEAIGMVILILAVAIGFWLDKGDWEHGVPKSATTQPSELLDETGNRISRK